MTQSVSYTTEEIASLLKISKLTVYDLIKKGELPSYRVGKQMRVDASDLEAYKQRSKGRSAFTDQAAQRTLSFAPPAPQSPMERSAGSPVLTGQDISLDILAGHLGREVQGLRPLRSHAGSLDSLISMYKGEADIVSTHLLDGDSGDYNIPYIRKLLIGMPYLVVNLLSRPAGLYVAQGNPLKLKQWSDLGRSNLKLINREIGSGARVLLEEQLRLHGITAANLSGYDNVQRSHLSVAAKVASGEGDVGIGTARAASMVESVDFIPLIQERYDLVIRKDKHTEPWRDALLAVLRSADFRQELQALTGYDLSLTGEILYET